MDNHETYPVLRLPAALLVFACVFVLTRLVLIVHPDTAAWYPMADEYPTGNVARDLPGGLILPLPLYQTKPFAAGTVYEGLLSYPFRLLFGPNLFSLKLAAVAWNLAAILLWIALAWRFIGRAAGLVAGVFFTLSPPFWALMTITAWGNHCESGLFSALALWLIFSALLRKDGFERGALAFAAGVAAGLGAYMTYTGALTILFGILVLAVLAGRTGLTRLIPAFLAGSSAGAAPILWSLRYYGKSALGTIDTYTGYASGEMVRAGRFFLEENLGQSARKFLSFWVHDLWRSTLMRDARVFPVSGAAMFAVLVIGATFFILVSRRESVKSWLARPLASRSRDEVRKSFRLVLLAFPMLFSLVYSLSGFRVPGDVTGELINYPSFRYLVPVYPFLFLICAVACQEIWERLEGRRIARGAALAVFALLAWGFAGYYTGVAASPPRFLAFLYRGDDPQNLMGKLAAETTKGLEGEGLKLGRIGTLTPTQRAVLFEQMARISEQGFQRGLVLSQGTALDFRPMLYRGLGLGIAERTWPDDRLKDPAGYAENVLKALPPVPEPFLPDFLEGLGWGIALVSREDQARLVEAVTSCDIRRGILKAPLLKGIGRKIGAGFHIDEKMSKPADVFYDRGLGAQLARNAWAYCLRSDPAANAILDFDAKRRPDLLRGFLAERREFFALGNYER